VSIAFPVPARALVVSCQARPDNPLHGAVFMAAMARAAEAGGAGGLRVNGPEDIAALRRVSALPIIGILKRRTEGFPVEITPGFDDAAAVVAAGADIVALDATARPRDGAPIAELIGRIRRDLARPVMADVATLAEGIAAAAAGAAAGATTLSGYTGAAPVAHDAPPDFGLVAALAAAIPVPVVAEGRLWTPEHAAEALRRGAHAVVVGTAITNPREITRRFVAGMGAS
jgi:putative N-acetylmannosamine-6-phosphate epimerase